MTDIGPFIECVRGTLAAHQSSQSGGVYSRFLHNANKAAEPPDVYGTADAVNILYTLGDLPVDSGEKETLKAALQGFQDPETGMFYGLHHHELHSAAFAISALELLDAKPVYALRKIEAFREKENLIALLDQLDWVNEPWGDSQKGSGIYACMVLSGLVSREWEEWYYDWLWDEADPLTGLWRKGCVPTASSQLKGAPLFHHIAGSFHYLFNLAYRNKPIRYPETILDTCIGLYRDGGWNHSGEALSFMEIDWVYTLSSCMKQTAHRYEEGLEVIRETAAPFIRYISRLGEESAEPFEDLHTLCGAISGLAVIQQTLPELVRTGKPLQLVLDRRPFI
ncbi:hypothetical protein KZ483_27890 [Paenibacillus sp. sptzw28]|uniref:hypothetical protein n=1 Tax=Paenibacillus sp. sptzw28 TaxID=715179 RepID=UPI001C6E22DE|nr:hypothetical protein [Paenibacillus sp. sptzw28]QYR21441.1 hypothetical protein KZ483_27890 [Paenibacillus sp. sptzw28]